MIRIVNTSRQRPNQARISVRSNWGAGTAAFPLLVDMGPGDILNVPDRAFADWDPGVKEWIAEYMVNGLLQVFTLDSAHHYLDKGHNSEYGLDWLVPPNDGMALTRALNMAGSLHVEMQLHFDSLSVHSSAVGTIGGSAPTDLTTLIAWLGSVATAYNTNHRPSAVAHPNVDIANTFTSAAVTLADAIDELKQLYGAYHAHKIWEFNRAQIGVGTVLAY